MRGDTDVAITFEWNGSGHDISLRLYDGYVTTGMVAYSFVCYNSPIVRVLSNCFLTVDLLLI
ncbi:isocitrate dehydrogenase [Enterobacter hormaechei ATCC 49162]|nr:isocitrate dehydrogenase [Enterobacter hormaechei ATCC 49162]